MDYLIDGEENILLKGKDGMKISHFQLRINNDVKSDLFF